MSRIIETARRRLARLETVEHTEAIEEAYERKAFGHGWKDLDGDGQDERAEILILFHRKRGTLGFADEEEERVTSGLWFCRFTGEEFTDAGDLDIDHLVPLKAAWLAGAHAWDEERRQQYANGFGIRSKRRRAWLLPVSSSANRSKGARGPDEWLPTRTEYHQRYAALWIRVKDYWGLSVTAAERAALEAILTTEDVA